jgi:3'-5' exoribonuclease
MDQPTLTQTKEFVRDLVDGQAVDSVFVVRDRNRRQKKNGDAFLKLQLGDVTGAVEAVVWDGVDEIASAADPGSVVRVAGRYAIDGRYGACVTVRTLRAAEDGEYDLTELLEGPSVAYDSMAARLSELIETVQQPHLRELLDRLLSPSTEIGRRWHDAPAAKSYHQAYRHGLLELPAGDGAGPAAHRALPPRKARARQPGGAVHTRGGAGPLH